MIVQHQKHYYLYHCRFLITLFYLSFLYGMICFMEINVIIEDDLILKHLSEDWFYEETEEILTISGAGQSEMGVSIVSDERIREINRMYRKIDKSTDVISFQMETQDGFIVPNDMRHLGDVVISAPTAIAQAVEYETSVEEEVRRLLIHGILHLLGFDHMQTENEAKMQDEEERITRIIGETND